MGDKERVDPNLGMNRRQLIRRGALVGGAVAWASPVVQSFTSPAFAQQGTPPPEGCPPENLRVGSIKFDLGSSAWVAQSFQATSNCLGPPPPGQCAAIDQYVAQLFNEAGIVPVGDPDEQVCVNAVPEPDCLVVRAAAAKTGGGSTACIPPDGGGLGLPVCFTARPGAGISNIQISVECCIPTEVIAQCP